MMIYLHEIIKIEKSQQEFKASELTESKKDFFRLCLTVTDSKNQKFEFHLFSDSKECLEIKE